MALAVVLSLSFAGAASAYAQPDRYCTRTHVTANDGFHTYWAAENVGLVGWRVYIDATVYDRCDHGAITGAVEIYTGNVQAHDGIARTWLEYARSDSNRWNTGFVALRYEYTYGGWDFYEIITDNNIGMVSTTRITWIKAPTYLMFYGVPGASRSEQCWMVSRSCAGYFGL